MLPRREEPAITAPDVSLSPLFDRLASRVSLTEDDREAVLALPQSVRHLRPGENFVRQGDAPTHCCLMASGFTVRDKVLADGARQILAVHMKGDMVDLQNVLLERSDHNVQALTDVDLVIIPRDALVELSFDRPSVGKALWLETLVDGAVFREWIANLGRRDARARIAHLLCEFGVKAEAAGVAEATSFELPMTQEQLADVVALTAVHVSRMLMALRKDGLIQRDGHRIRIPDWEKLADVAGFHPDYLHLPRSKSERLH